MNHFFLWLDKNENIGFILLRLFAGLRLIYGVIDNIISWEKMQEFGNFLTVFHFPFPLISAIVSVYIQALAGLSFISGWKIRYAAMLMIVNFGIALVMVHAGQSFEEMTPALALLCISILLLFTGAKRK